MQHERSITLLDDPASSDGGTPAPSLRFRGTFQAIFGVLAVVPVVTSLVALTFGAGRHGDSADVPAELDSQLRYLGGVYFVVALVIVYAVLNIERARTIATVLGSAIFVGGLGRLASWASEGRPDGLTTFFIAVELVVVPLVVLAYRRSFTRPSPTEGVAP